jgi:hypothetical protein
MKTITVIIEYEKEEDVPVFHSGMTALGGKIIAVAFTDILKELERRHDGR